MDLHVRHYYLPNGLEVVLEEDHHSPEIAIDLRVHAGAKDDPSGKSGLAHLVEHVTAASARHVPGGSVDLMLIAAGALDSNAATSTSTTDFFSTVPASRLATALWGMSDELGFVDPTPAILDRERSVVERERAERALDPPDASVTLILRSCLLPGDAYASSPGGAPADLATVTVQDVDGFRARHYSPDNATLAIVGDLDPAAAARLVEQWFGSIAPHGSTLDRRIAPLSTAARAPVTIEADVAYRSVVLAWPLPARSAPGYLEALAALEVLHSRLYTVLVLSGRALRTVRVGAQAESAFTMGWLTFELEDPDDTQAVIDRFTQIQSHLPDEDHDVSSGRIRTSFTVRRAYALESLRGRAFTMLDDLDAYGTPDASEMLMTKFAAIDEDGVSWAMREFFTPERALVAYVVPKPGAPRGGRLVGAP